jgi:hypothetical protein
MHSLRRTHIHCIYYEVYSTLLLTSFWYLTCVHPAQDCYSLARGRGWSKEKNWVLNIQTTSSGYCTVLYRTLHSWIRSNTGSLHSSNTGRLLILHLKKRELAYCSWRWQKGKPQLHSTWRRHVTYFVGKARFEPRILGTKLSAMTTVLHALWRWQKCYEVSLNAIDAIGQLEGHSQPGHLNLPHRRHMFGYEQHNDVVDWCISEFVRKKAARKEVLLLSLAGIIIQKNAAVCSKKRLLRTSTVRPMEITSWISI